MDSVPFLGSADPLLPPPLPAAAPKVWAAREGELPPARVQGYTGRFEEIVQVSPDVRIFRITLDGYREVFPFAAGQFAQLIGHVPDPSQPNGTKRVPRSYSIASPAEERRYLELAIKLNLTGAFTPYLWTKRAGDTLDLRGPFGKFVLKEPLDTDQLFISAGTGITPFWSMIHNLLETRGFQRRIVLLAGFRYEVDVLYAREFQALAARHPNFTPVFVLSRPRDPGTWRGSRGYVQDWIPQNVTDPAGVTAYLCGLSRMIDETKERLHALGVPGDRVLFERYD